MKFPGKFTFRYALTVPFRIAPLITIIMMADHFLALALAPINVLLTAYFIDTALAVFNEGADVSLIYPPIIAFIAFQAYGRIAQPFFELMHVKRNIKTRLAMRVPLVEKRVRLEFKHMENNDTVDLLNRVWESPEYNISNILQNLTNFFTMVGTTISSAVILILSAPFAGAVIIVMSVPVVYFAIKGGKERYQANRDMTKLDRTFWSLSWFLTGARYVVAERNLFRYTDYLDKRYLEAFERSRKYKLKVRINFFLRSKGAAVLMGLFSSAAFFLMVPSVINGQVSVGLYISLIGSLFGTVNSIGWGLPYYFEQFAHQREFLKDLNKFLELSETKDAETLPSAVPPDFQKLEFKNVSFTYPGTEKKILDGASFTIEKGKHYSFVGVNGAGKTTITKLLTRLYDEYDGEILFNGKSLRDYSLADVKAAFCAVFQDFAKYDITVRENIAIGKMNGADEEEIDAAIKLAGFTDSVNKLKSGKDTLLGKTQEEGVDLSGGEWQRLAFARAIVSPAPIKILDEPTAALDPVAESGMYAQFEEISRGVTTLFISHRLASAKMSDVIFVLDDGKIAEMGNHNDLMAKNGIYTEMFESQRMWYQ